MCLMGNTELLCMQCRGIEPHLELICGTWSYFTLLRLPQGHYRFVTIFLGTLCTCIKHVKGPYMYDGVHRIALPAMKGKWTSSHGKGKV